MDKILEDRSRLKTIYIMDNTTGRSIRFDKVTVRDSDEFLDSNGKPQFFITYARTPATLVVRGSNLAHLKFPKLGGSFFEEISPVLILDPNRLLVLAVKCTSHWVRKCNDLDYEVQKWAESGLHKETTIMFDYPLELERSDILDKIGHLDSYDIQWVDKKVTEIIAVSYENK